jgi:hypothetical protein
MKRVTIISLSALLTASAAPAAFGWGYHGGGFSGGSYHGAYGGSFSHSDGSWSATGARGSTASGGGGSWSGTGFRGGTASGGGGSWNAHGAYGGTAYGGYGGYHGAYYGGGYHGGYYGGTAVATPGYAGMAPRLQVWRSALRRPPRPMRRPAPTTIRRPITGHLRGSIGKARRARCIRRSQKYRVGLMPN